MAAPLAGKLSDRKGSAFTVTVATISTIAAFILMGAWISLPSLVIGVLLMDLGVQSVQVAAQSHVMAIVPEARSRMNTLYMVARFIGGATGSILGAAAYSHYHWIGVCGLGVVMLLVALAVHLIIGE